MIEVTCGCATAKKVPESAIGKRFRCSDCAQTIQLVAGEPLADGAADFDAGLLIMAGPERAGEKILLGGVADIEIGKLPDRQIMLPGTLVSRGHCTLKRIDFGPSRWKLVDNRSTNGLFVNGQRITEQELRDGDLITVGNYDLQFFAATPELEAIEESHERVMPASAQAGAVSTRARQSTGTVQTASGGPVCPSCEKSLPRSAKICVDCGIKIDSGRPMLTSQGLDENSIYESAYQWIRWISLLIWVTPMPIPIRSEAFGVRKPYTIWTIAAATVLASITFFIAQSSDDSGGFDRPGKNLMLWARGERHELAIDPAKVHELAQDLTEADRQELRAKLNDPRHRLSDEELVSRTIAMIVHEKLGDSGEFHWYQLITHAFLHDTSSLWAFANHLGGNMLFLLVFGTRVNALIGNIATAILYPILAVCAATAHLMSLGPNHVGPMLGASGAIMGLAGMYLILFPIHKVICAMWISIWLRFRRIFGCKIFSMRGFWLLLVYFGYDIVSQMISQHLGGGGGGVAHWAHIGGFITGMILAMGILFSRQFNTHGGDILSVSLGKYAWPLIGKPSQWINAAPVYPRAMSLNM